MTAPQTPPLSAEDARERQCRMHLARCCAHGDPLIREAFEAGWAGANEAPPLPWLYRTWRPMVAAAHRAGRRAARAYARTLAKEDADAAR